VRESRLGRYVQLFGPALRRDNPAATPHAEAVGKGCVRLPSKVLTGILAIGLAVCAVAAIAPLSRAWLAPAQAQQRAAINVTPTTQAEPASRTRLAIQVGPREAIAANSFIRIRGLPPTVALTEGHVVAPGSWAIPLAALPNLSIILPIGLQGQSDIAISLVSVDGAVLAEARTTLVVAAAAAPPPRPSPREAQSPPSGARVVPTLAPADRERALGLHAKGQEQLERGSIYAARKFFERAADIGLAQSAVALADTYDPEELARLRVIGIQADVEAAKRWYEKARELGAAEASDRLRRLGQR
jgi:TPR repeat protein